MTSSATVTSRDPTRDAHGWPVGHFTSTDRTGITHEVTPWWDDDEEQVRTRCQRYFRDTVDKPARPVTCILCLVKEPDA